MTISEILSGTPFRIKGKYETYTIKRAVIEVSSGYSYPVAIITKVTESEVHFKTLPFLNMPQINGSFKLTEIEE